MKRLKRLMLLLTYEGNQPACELALTYQFTSATQSLFLSPCFQSLNYSNIKTVSIMTNNSFFFIKQTINTLVLIPTFPSAKYQQSIYILFRTCTSLCPFLHELVFLHNHVLIHHFNHQINQLFMYKVTAYNLKNIFLKTFPHNPFIHSKPNLTWVMAQWVLRRLHPPV